MRRITLIVHLSLDGYVAGPKGNLGYFIGTDENLKFVNTLTKNADTALFGRNSYEMINGFWPDRYKSPEATPADIEYSNWYNAAKKIVISTTLKETTAANVTIINKNVEAEISKIKQSEGKDILIFGSPGLSQTLMDSGIIDDFRVFIHPIFFGQGIRLFDGLSHRVELQLLKTTTLSTGDVTMHYVKK